MTSVVHAVVMLEVVFSFWEWNAFMDKLNLSFLGLLKMGFLILL